MMEAKAEFRFTGQNPCSHCIVCLCAHFCNSTIITFKLLLLLPSLHVVLHNVHIQTEAYELTLLEVDIETEVSALSLNVFASVTIINFLDCLMRALELNAPSIQSQFPSQDSASGSGSIARVQNALFIRLQVMQLTVQCFWDFLLEFIWLIQSCNYILHLSSFNDTGSKMGQQTYSQN